MSSPCFLRVSTVRSKVQPTKVHQAHFELWALKLCRHPSRGDAGRKKPPNQPFSLFGYPYFSSRSFLKKLYSDHFSWFHVPYNNPSSLLFSSTSSASIIPLILSHTPQYHISEHTVGNRILPLQLTLSFTAPTSIHIAQLSMASIWPSENGLQANQALTRTSTPFEWQNQLDHLVMNFDFAQAHNLASMPGDHEPQAGQALPDSDPAQELPLSSTPFELDQEFNLPSMPEDQGPHADQDLADIDFGQEFNLPPMPFEFDHELTLPSMLGAHEPQASLVLCDYDLAQELDLTSMPEDHESRGEPSPFSNSYLAANASYPYFGSPSLGCSSGHESNSSSDLEQQQQQEQHQHQQTGNIQTSDVYECRRRESREGKAYRECSSPNDVANYWNSRHTSVDTPRPKPIRYKSPEQRALARLEKKALDEARRAKKLAVREKEMKKRDGGKDGEKD